MERMRYPNNSLLSDGIQRSRRRSPTLANAHMERLVGSVRRECLDRLLIVGRRQLEHVLRVYVRYYNRARPHRALDLKSPEPSTGSPAQAESNLQSLRLRRLDLLGGLIHEYEIPAAA